MDFNSSNAINLSLTSEQVLGDFYIRNYVIILLYIPVFLLALIANVLVIAIVIKYHYMRNVTNYFLVNLAVADLLVTLVCMPNAVWHSYTLLWYIGDVTCKISHYLQCVSVASSVFTITAMAVDRYLSITRPFGFFSRCFNKKTTIVVIIVLWITSMLLFAPILIVTQLVADTIPNVNITITLCVEVWDNDYMSRDIFGIICFVAMFAIPGIIMMWSYIMMGKNLFSFIPPFDNNEGNSSTRQSSRLVRERRRLAWILLFLAILFAFCWLPYNVINLLLDTKKLEGTIGNNLRTIRPYMLLLGHANSALNPIIYCIMSKNFRRSVKELFASWAVRRQQNQNQWVESSASSQRLYLQRLKSIPLVTNHYNNTSRLRSSQKTTKTFAV